VVSVIPKIFLGDCMEAMKEMPDKAYELAIVDPPYGIGDFIQGIGPQKKSVNWTVDWNESIPDPKFFIELRRISKNQIIWGANYYNCFNGLNGAVIWNKLVTHPDMSKCEIASVSHYKKVEIVTIEWNGFIKTERGKTIHPCQKPVRLYEWLLKNYAKPGDKILDTHLGSGSSAIAAYEMGFDFTGYEIDADYFKSAKERLERHMKQGRLWE
jgi:site-specific DNA-methyltransferase (adenine-specific)